MILFAVAQDDKVMREMEKRSEKLLNEANANILSASALSVGLASVVATLAKPVTGIVPKDLRTREPVQS